MSVVVLRLIGKVCFNLFMSEINRIYLKLLVADNENPRKSEEKPPPPNEADQAQASKLVADEPGVADQQQISDTESVQSSTEETKDEKLFVRTVRSIRKKFMARKLIGNIEIYRAGAFVSTSMKCNIGEIDYERQPRPSADSQESLEGLSGNFLRAITMSDSLLDSMERRAMKWENSDYHDQVLLSRGTRLQLPDPFFGMLGYTLSIELTATVTSLVESRRRYLAQRVPWTKQMSDFAGNLTYGKEKKKEEVAPAGNKKEAAPSVAEKKKEAFGPVENKKEEAVLMENKIEEAVPMGNKKEEDLPNNKKPFSLENTTEHHPAEGHQKATSN